jgi:phage shock protein E
MGLFSSLFGTASGVDFRTLIDEGAVIVDVRTKGEFDGGHIKGSINMPLDSLPKNLGKLKKEKVIITVCQSGMRSSAASRLLKQNGFTAYNGGCWYSLQ